MSSYYLSPVGNSPLVNTNGTPLAGGTITTYQAGSSTPVASFTDYTGSTPQPASIPLNVYGLPASPIWLISGVAYKFVIKDALGNLIASPDYIYGINDPSPITASQTALRPAFSAYQSSTNAFPTGTFTKVQLQSKEFDTANAFDNITNFRYTPLVAGYYQVNGALAFNSAAQTTLSIYKNGAEFKRSENATANQVGVSALIYFNGSTDYIELWGYQASGSSQNSATGAAYTYLQAFHARNP